MQGLLVAVFLVAALGSAATAGGSVAPVPDPPSLAVATYNVRSGLGAGWGRRAPSTVVRRNLDAVAATLAAAAGPGAPPLDFVALNEVDFGSRRSGWIDQAGYLAAALLRRTGARYEIVRGETWRRKVPGFEIRFGNAALVRHPVVDVLACDLFSRRPCGKPAPADAADPFLRRLLEPRGMLRVTFESPVGRVDALVTHLDPFLSSVREAQAARLLARFVEPQRTTLLLGDMNAEPADRTHAILTGASLRDPRVGRVDPTGTSWATFPAAAPVRAIDWILASPALAPRSLAVIGESASDHRGFFVRFEREAP